MTEHETTASLRRAAPLRRWTILWAGALWIGAAVVLVTVAFGCSGGAEPDGPDDGPAVAEPGGAEAEAGQDNAPPRSPAAAPPTTRPAAEPDCEALALRADETGQAALDTPRAEGETFEGWALGAPLTAGNARRALERAGCPPPAEGSPAAEAKAMWDRLNAAETARIQAAAEDAKAAEASDRAAAEAAVAEAWERVTGGAFSETDGALSEDDLSQTTDPGAGSNPDRPGCQTDDNPVACQPPVVEGDPEGEIDGETAPDPDPEAGADPEPEGEIDPETPQSIIDFEDKAAEVVRPAETTRQHPGPVAYPAPVRLGSLADLLCPPEEAWREASYTGCGDGSDNDYLAKRLGAQTVNACWRGPIRLGVGDVLRMVRSDTHEIAGIRTWTSTVTSEILGFSEIDPASTAGWVLTQPLRRSVRVDAWTLDDGTEEAERSESTGSPPNKWMQIGGPDNRGLYPDGSLAWGLMMIPTGDPEAC